ncbi:hypothetical protein J437_LFUL012082 [Ladona fulva]|uniref:Acyltransferase 3 domain-containing protein n=1 Tax=Ladona fulva TaxID=123851 RepID=A0A8K0JXJ9_LADFU|nr:hypothetical protein J437_LFUL012082 [Ladona fulva]
MVCVIQSWYVAVEFHVFLVCAPLALMFRSRPTLATRILIFAAVTSLLVPFILTAVLHLDPVLMPYISVLQDLSRDPTFLKVYIPSYMRMAPYFFGMICALAIRRANKRSLKLRKSVVIICHVCSFLMCLLVCYSSWIFFQPDIPRLHPLAAAAFTSFTRIGWSLAMMWQLFSAATGWIGRMMSWRPLTPFGRLTYGAFLTHAGIQLYDVSTLVTPQHVTIFYMITKNVSDYFFSNFLAMVLFLCIEGPVASLEKILTGSSSREKGSAAVGGPQNQQTFTFVAPSVVTTGKLVSEESQH